MIALPKLTLDAENKKFLGRGKYALGTHRRSLGSGHRVQEAGEGASSC